MVIYVVSLLYTQCLRHNICSAWFLDITISTCFCSKYNVFSCNIINLLADLIVNKFYNLNNQALSSEVKITVFIALIMNTIIIVLPQIMAGLISMPGLVLWPE